ncbi:MAG TPA: CoA-binding protein [Desulfurivibrio alkaliphilus]|uniref:CoA-binding protein n=1 Tax=Desulfurivibrio alkaliphilus TaxID=427923 RepID=A0A7C2TL88_9BACT|nr:CoA-binding protein [Desulfurivibrio alkaliphilus]
MLLPDFQLSRRILSPDPRTGALPVIAVVGLSPKSERPSNVVARYLLARGFKVIPVNPGQGEILSQPCYPDLTSIGRPVDIVVIFRRSEQVLPVVREAIRTGAATVWLQEGIVNQEAAALAEAAGLTVIMDRCIKTVHEALGLSS